MFKKKCCRQSRQGQVFGHHDKIAHTKKYKKTHRTQHKNIEHRLCGGKFLFIKMNTCQSVNNVRLFWTHAWGFPPSVVILQLQCCYIAAPMLLYCSSDVAILQLRCCYSAAPCSVAILQLQYCYSAAPVLLYCSSNVVLLQLQCCYIAAPMLL